MNAVERGRVVLRGRPRAGADRPHASGWSLLLGRRSLAAAAGCVVVLVLLAVAALGMGDYAISPGQVIAALAGSATDPLASYFVTELRAPRAVAAIVVGVALGVAGALFQNVTRNPLGSPDIIGFTTGAATGALIQIVLLDASGPAIGVGALLGGAGTAALVRLLVGRDGLGGAQLVLVGLGVGATLAALNTLLVVRASLESAQTAAVWLAGSLNTMLWPKVLVAAVAVVVLVAVLGPFARGLSQIALGEDAARATGVDVTRVRSVAVVVGVALVSVAVALTGPIAFVALAAPQVARRLAGLSTPGLVSSALVGAVLVLGADLVAQHAFAEREYSVGVVTGALGGIYLIGLLILERRRR